MVPFVLLLGACGEESAGSGDPPTGDSGARAPADGGGDGQQYEVSGTMFQEAGGEPMLCAVLMESMPPQCGDGLPVAGWDWDAVAAESASGVRWGHFVLTGTWDGERFTVTAPAEREAPDGAPPAPREPERPEAPADELDADQLNEVRRELVDDYPHDVLSAHVDEEHGVVRADVVLDSPELREELAGEFGDGTVVPTGWLRPVTGGE
ncbi:hypothetical protein [Streptomyces marincola]|uniref:hypothetical protein n=1 Tax=Streptomyces marincola TaxID=2878388 RepID=UPI000A35A8B9|nr:hypothetical protein [Streptomyces marincola]